MDDPRKYMQIANDVRMKIKAGDLKPGDQVPPLQTFGTARQTAAKGLNVLVEEGLLIRYPGLGYYVTDTGAL